MGKKEISSDLEVEVRPTPTNQQTLKREEKN